MSRRSTTGSILLGLAFLVVVCGVVWKVAFSQPAKTADSAKPAAPAEVAKPLKEESLATITLTEQAETAIDLATAPVERKPVPRMRLFGGEITVPLGRTVVVSAPIGGMLKLAAPDILQPGMNVEKGQVIFQLLPLLTPESTANLATAKIDAESKIGAAETEVEASKIALDRATKLYEKEAGSRRTVDEARAANDLAQEALKAAKSRFKFLERVAGDIEAGTAGPIDIESPETGFLRTVSALPGQNVPSGAPLFEVANIENVWIKVPIYVGDLSQIDTTLEVAVGPLSAKPGELKYRAKTVNAPPSATAATGTVDVFYVLENKDAKFRPGQRVSVQLPFDESVDSLTVPWSAVIHDIYGGTWVYEKTGERIFVRRRVVVRFVQDGTAVLASGPQPDAQIVTAGAVELFGAETGFTK